MSPFCWKGFYLFIYLSFFPLLLVVAECSPENVMCCVWLYSNLFISAPFSPTHPASSCQHSHMHCCLRWSLQVKPTTVLTSGECESCSPLFGQRCSCIWIFCCGQNANAVEMWMQSKCGYSQNVFCSLKIHFKCFVVFIIFHKDLVSHPTPYPEPVLKKP